MFVPLIGGSVPEVEGASVTVTFTSSESLQKEAGFSIFGTGAKRGLDVSLTEINTLDVGPGEARTYGAQVPVVWKQVSQGPTDDGPLVTIVEPIGLAIQDKPGKDYYEGLSATEFVSRERVNARNAPRRKPQSHKTQFGRKLNTTMQVGAKLDSIGLQVMLTLGVTRSITVDGVAMLPPGLEYDINWLAGLPSLALTLGR